MADQTPVDSVKAKALYNALVQDRNPYVTRAQRNAAITVPYLFPKDGTTGASDLDNTNQSLGSRGLRQLASKLQMALFPINAPFFKYQIDDLALATLAKSNDKRGSVEAALSARERAVLSEMNSSMFRPISFEACRQLVVAGNYLLYVPKKGRPRGFRLSSYVVQRDPSGNVLDIVVLETIARTALPVKIRDQLPPADASLARDAKIEVYTRISLNDEGTQYVVTQEIDDVVIAGEYGGTYPVDKCPWLPIRLTVLEGEDYGRAFVDEYVGDLTSLNALTGAIRDGTMQAAKVVWLVAPNSTTSATKLAKAENGGFVQGSKDHITCLQMEKAADFSVAERLIQSLTERLSYAFLLNSAVQRSGERVTAEEIRFMAGELDQGLGGIYSLLAEEFQMPVAKLYGLRMEAVRKVPPLPKEISSTSIVTGLDALGRGNDLTNLDTFIQGAAQTFGPMVIEKRINDEEYFKRRGASLGIDTGGLVRTDEEIQAITDADHQRELLTAGVPNAVAQAGGAIRDQQQQAADAATQQETQ
ncbi:portal protein [Rhizobium sp. BK376]|uniref:portal protein n=1 Tax=Rhizobium sp. BK376 TaxID=2512149 RepID=UPI0010511A87|nr:portal protein [Rhizobium sp. BK376]TCR92592.1 head-to-tail connecting protein [Rhizobium sp. BK376]